MLSGSIEYRVDHALRQPRIRAKAQKPTVTTRLLESPGRAVASKGVMFGTRVIIITGRRVACDAVTSGSPDVP